MHHADGSQKTQRGENLPRELTYETERDTLERRGPQHVVQRVREQLEDQTPEPAVQTRRRVVLALALILVPAPVHERVEHRDHVRMPLRRRRRRRPAARVVTSFIKRGRVPAQRP